MLIIVTGTNSLGNHYMAHIPDDAPLFRFQDLPEDLARLVFEAAAHDVDKPNWSCALVSTTAIVIDTPWKMTLLGQTMSHHPAKAPAFFSTHVEQIYIIIRRDRLNPSYSDLYSLELLSACPNIWRWSNGSQEARKGDVENFWKRAEDKVATRSSERPLVL
ncbi:hypothetical protein D9611_011353 [Ephemerocybe angulata]|uniref:Uncharacterized protein n=1 Tax=Ephemerocybe angulata TaxID=980116 RepID=A0A8H5BBP9_9AGAR|nr:hypothetical protein D9611_011353 [Tulosesus angulatus]